MPTYPTNNTFWGGFYNNKRVNGVDDRIYTAKDVRKPYDTVFTDGIMPDADGTVGDMLLVTLTGGMGIAVNAGSAKLGGAWFENTATYNIVLDAVGSEFRYDCVIIRNDDSDDVRAPSIYIKSLNAPPTEADLVRTGDIYEICVAYIQIPSLSTELSDANLVDTREDGKLCNIMSGVGAVVVRNFHNTYYSERAGQTTIPIGIKQYNRTRDILTVIVNGSVFAEGVNYSILSNDDIELNIGLPVVGTKIDFEVAKNVNAKGAETVIQEVAQLQKEVKAVNDKLEHHYYCNGKNDNVIISNIISEFLNGGLDNSSMRLIVHGYFGASSPVSGSGSGSSPYVWMQLALNNASSRRVIVDFSDCREIVIECEQPTYNVILGGHDVNIVGANITARGGNYIYLFSTAKNIIPYVENCRFWVTSNIGGIIASGGTFKNCKVIHTVISGNAYSFDVTSVGLLRIIGGEYCAYANESYFAAVVRIGTGQAGAVAILDGVNMPESYKSGYTQVDCIVHRSGHLRCTDLITTLGTDVMSETSEFRGTIEVSKPSMM